MMVEHGRGRDVENRLLELDQRLLADQTGRVRVIDALQLGEHFLLERGAHEVPPRMMAWSWVARGKAVTCGPFLLPVDWLALTSPSRRQDERAGNTRMHREHLSALT
jgi:hypothetical protein